MSKRRGKMNKDKFNDVGSNNWKKNVELSTLGSNSFVQDFCCLTMKPESVGQNGGLTGCTAN